MPRDLLCYFVALQHMLERSHLKTKFIREVDEHHYLIRAVTVGVDIAFAFENFYQRLELQIAPRWNQILFTTRSGSTILVPAFLVIARACEGVSNYFLDSHARVWIATLHAGKVWRARAFGIFSKRELDTRHSAGKDKLTGRPSVFDLHYSIQATDRIRRTMQQI